MDRERGCQRPRLMLLALAAALMLHPAQLASQRPAYFFGELGGPGGLGSVNLEVNPVAALRLRAGAGFFVWPSVPLTATYSLGSDHHALEFGGGATIVFLSAYHASTPVHGPGTLFDVRDDGVLAIASGALGYRYSSAKGFLFRAMITPLYAQGDGLLWFGISLGQAFKG